MWSSFRFVFSVWLFYWSSVVVIVAGNRRVTIDIIHIAAIASNHPSNLVNRSFIRRVRWCQRILLEQVMITSPPASTRFRLLDNINNDTLFLSLLIWPRWRARTCTTPASKHCEPVSSRKKQWSKSNVRVLFVCFALPSTKLLLVQCEKKTKPSTFGVFLSLVLSRVSSTDICVFKQEI